MISGPVVFYDGHCALCSRSVQFILTHDRKKRFRFAALQFETAAELGTALPETDSVILFHNERFYVESSAALHIVKQLNLPWNLLAVFLLLPAWLRDPVYRFIASNRYRWFGRYETCWLPDLQWRDRFLT